MQFTAQTATYQWISFITACMDNNDEDKRTEQSLIVRSGKSKAEVTNNRRLRSTIVLLKLTTGRHKASRGLSILRQKS